MAGQAKGNSCSFVPISDREPYPNSNAYADSDPHTDANADCHTNGNTKSNRYTETLSYTPAAANAATSPHTSPGIKMMIGVSAAAAAGAQKCRRLQA
jgi:hypothetical protein